MRIAFRISISPNVLAGLALLAFATLGIVAA